MCDIITSLEREGMNRRKMSIVFRFLSFALLAVPEHRRKLRRSVVFAFPLEMFFTYTVGRLISNRYDDIGECDIR